MYIKYQFSWFCNFLILLPCGITMLENLRGTKQVGITSVEVHSKMFEL